jgi:hypothetical protein
MGKFGKILRAILTTPELYIILFGFLINFWYEVSQVPFFLGVNRGQSYFEPNTFETRLFFVKTFNRAGFLDSLICLGCHVINSIVFGSRFWFVRGGKLFGFGKKHMKPWIGHILSAIIASGFLVYTEYNAAVNDLWDYDPSMPLIWEMGLIPIVAMLFTPNLAFIFTGMVYKGHIQTKVADNEKIDLNSVDNPEKAMKYVEQLKKYRYIGPENGKKEWIGIAIIFVVLVAVLYWYFAFFS